MCDVTNNFHGCNRVWGEAISWSWNPQAATNDENLEGNLNGLGKTIRCGLR